MAQTMHLHRLGILHCHCVLSLCIVDETCKNLEQLELEMKKKTYLMAQTMQMHCLGLHCHCVVVGCH